MAKKKTNAKKIAVVSIMKNESQFIKRWADSAREADYLILLDTGSTDDSVQVAKDNNIIIHEHVVNTEKFFPTAPDIFRFYISMKITES